MGTDAENVSRPLPRLDDASDYYETLLRLIERDMARGSFTLGDMQDLVHVRRKVEVTRALNEWNRDTLNFQATWNLATTASYLSWGRWFLTELNSFIYWNKVKRLVNE